MSVVPRFDVGRSNGGARPGSCSSLGFARDDSAEKKCVSSRQPPLIPTEGMIGAPGRQKHYQSFTSLPELTGLTGIYI